MVTRKDVAKRAGVSDAVVSYVLNNKKKVKEETRQRVLKAAADLEYQPHQTARSLKLKKTFQIAVLVNNLGNPFEAGLLLGMENVARSAGYSVFFQTYREQDEHALKRLFAGRADGIVLIGQSLLDETVEYFVKMKVPLVSAGASAVRHPRIPVADIDWIEAMDGLIGHLRACGHTRIGFMTGGGEREYYEHRLQAFIEAVRRKGLAFGDGMLLSGGGKFETGFDAMGKAWDASNGSFPFTALVCANDLMAIGANAAVKLRRTEESAVPAIVGCEDILMASQIEPPLTTLHYPRDVIARSTIDMLLRGLAGESASDFTASADLRVRASG